MISMKAECLQVQSRTLRTIPVTVHCFRVDGMHYPHLILSSALTWSRWEIIGKFIHVETKSGI